MTSAWVVAMEATADGSSAELPKATLEALVEAVADAEVVGLYSPDRYAVQLRVMAGNPQEALDLALRRWAAVVRSGGAPAWNVVRAEVMTRAELDSELEAEGGARHSDQAPAEDNAGVNTPRSPATPTGGQPAKELVSDDRWRLILQDSHERLILLSADGFIFSSSPDLGPRGVAGAEEPGSTALADIAHPEDAVLVDDAIAHILTGDADTVTFVTRLRSGDGWRWYRATARNLLREPSVQAIVVTCGDVSKEKELEERLAELAHHDELTGLVTRAVFLDAVELALARLVERSQVGVFFVDIDDFRGLVERLGTRAGDELLMAIGERMRSLRDGPGSARLGRDEFALLFDNLAGSAEAGQTAKSIASTLSQPVAIGGQDVSVAVSIGVALGSSERLQAATLLRHAEIAMYRARRGRARYEIFRRRRQSPTGSDRPN